jgi:hypothetical protein
LYPSSSFPILPSYSSYILLLLPFIIPSILSLLLLFSPFSVSLIFFSYSSCPYLTFPLLPLLLFFLSVSSFSPSYPSFPIFHILSQIPLFLTQFFRLPSHVSLSPFILYLTNTVLCTGSHVLGRRLGTATATESCAHFQTHDAVFLRALPQNKPARNKVAQSRLEPVLSLPHFIFTIDSLLCPDDGGMTFLRNARPTKTVRQHSSFCKCRFKISRSRTIAVHQIWEQCWKYCDGRNTWSCQTKSSIHFM